MNKEWQEATNEYLKVNISASNHVLFDDASILDIGND
jgi:hypothetical protein